MDVRLNARSGLSVIWRTMNLPIRPHPSLCYAFATLHTTSPRVELETVTFHVVCHAASDMPESMSGVSVFISSQTSTHARPSGRTLLLITATRLPGFTTLFSTRHVVTNASSCRSKFAFYTFIHVCARLDINTARTVTAQLCCPTGTASPERKDQS
jgi:hypothetical protein